MAESERTASARRAGEGADPCAVNVDCIHCWTRGPHHGARSCRGNIQVLFGDKEALQLATLEEAVNLYDAAVVVPAMNKKSPLAKLLALVDGWFKFVERRALPGGYFMNAVSNEYRRVRDQIGKHRSTIRSRLRKLIVEAKEAGELRADVDVEQLMFDLIASEAAANVA